VAVPATDATAAHGGVVDFGAAATKGKAMQGAE
jgi:hypothetical protein